MARLAVDPAVLAGAGVGLIGVGEGLGPAVAALSAAYNANTGQDTAGEMFGRRYTDAGRGLMDAVAAGINALLRTGYGVQVSAVNYSRAEAHSDLSRRAQPLEWPPCPADVAAAGAPSASGVGVGQPSLWAVVEMLVGDLWPSGSPTQMRIAAGAWRTFASVLHGISFEVSGPYNTVAAQEIPEGESIKSVIRDIGTAFGQMARGCEELAVAVEGFAAGVENTQNAIRRLLAKLGSIGSIVGVFFEFVRGRGERDLEEIAADIRTVMGHLKSEADAHKAQIEQALRDFEALNSAMQIVADREFKEFFGEDVGNVLSEVWRAGADIDRGIARWTASTAESLEALDPTRFFYDPQGAFQTWKGLEQMAEVVMNPGANPELTKEIVKGLARVEEWKTQRPLTALTENVLDVGTLFLGPEAAAGGMSKLSAMGDIAKVAKGLDETTLAGSLGKIGDVARPAGALDEISTHTGQLTRDLETTGVSPAGGKPVGGPIVDKPAGTPVPDKPGSAPIADKPAVAAVGDAKPIGGKPISPEKPSGLPTSPVESRSAAANASPEAKAVATPAALKPYGNDTANPAIGEIAPGTPADRPSGIAARTDAGEGNSLGVNGGPPHGEPAPNVGGGQVGETHANTGKAGAVPETSDDLAHAGGGKHSVGAAIGDRAGAPMGPIDHSVGGIRDLGATTGPVSPHPNVEGKPVLSDVNGDTPLAGSQRILSNDEFEVGRYHSDAPASAAELNNAFVNGQPIETLARQVAEYSTHYAPGVLEDRLVLGKWDGYEGGYIGEAVRNGGIYFDTGRETWESITRGLGEREAKELGWQVNEQVLRLQLERGVGQIDYILDHGQFASLEEKALADPRSFSAMEIRFLIRNAESYGYRRVGDSWIRISGVP